MALRSSSSLWVDKVRHALGPTGYCHDNSKYRKSLQTAVLFEAKRAVDRYEAETSTTTANDNEDTDDAVMTANAVQGRPPQRQQQQQRRPRRRLKSYERKYALLRQSHYLLGQLVQSGMLTSNQKDQVLWKTGTSQQLLDADAAWRRTKAIERDLAELAVQIKPYYSVENQENDETCTGGAQQGAGPVVDTTTTTTHDEAVDRMVRAHYESTATTEYVKAYKDVMGTREWELAHNHLLFTFRLYYKGSQLNPDFPPPDDLVMMMNDDGNGGSSGVDPGILGAPMGAYRRRGRRPNNDGRASTNSAAGQNGVHMGPLHHFQHPHMSNLGGEDADDGNDTSHGSDDDPLVMMGPLQLAGGMDVAAVAAAATSRPGPVPGASSVTAVTAATATVIDPIADERRKLLQEVKDHLELLKEFEGLVSPDELAQRKRQLYMALPPAPPPHAATLHGPLQQQQLPRPRNSMPSPERNQGAKRSRS